MAHRRIPPIQCLLTFEAVARLRSASRAAEELCVTVSAVSHRLRQLESHLGVRLFSRSDFTPTAEAVLRPATHLDGPELRYDTPAAEFALSVLTLDGDYLGHQIDVPARPGDVAGPQILVCARGTVTVLAAIPSPSQAVWYLGPVPLRAWRSTHAARTRPAVTASASTRSMRMPRFW